MLRYIVAALAVVAISLLPGSPAAAPTSVVADGQSVTPADLLPSSVFKLGMPIGELEALLARDFKGWERSETTRSLNNRNDPILPDFAKAPYLQTIQITHLDEREGVRRTYSLALDSPLSGSRLYSVVFELEALGPSNDLGSVITVAPYLYAMWGNAHRGSHKRDRARFTYLFDRQGQLVRDNGASCAPLFTAMVRLDEKTPDEVMKVLAMIDSSGCGSSKDLHLRLRDDGNTITGSRFYNSDVTNNPRDVLKRVRYGQP